MECREPWRKPSWPTKSCRLIKSPSGSTKSFWVGVLRNDDGNHRTRIRLDTWLHREKLRDRHFGQQEIPDRKPLDQIGHESGSTSFGDFYRKLSTADQTLRDKIVDAITTNETLWFRDGSPWRVMRDVILPEYLEYAAKQPMHKFRIWSAACSTGQEPYTIAMLIDEFCRLRGGTTLTPDKFEIIATDISPSALFIAMAGRFDPISMKRGFVGEYEKYRDQYFTKKGTVSVINDSIKSRVKFQRFNLQDSYMSLGKFDLVFLRNVAIYFADALKRDIFDRIANQLHPQGIFFLGSAESLTGYSTRFEMKNHQQAVFYRKKA